MSNIPDPNVFNFIFVLPNALIFTACPLMSNLSELAVKVILLVFTPYSIKSLAKEFCQLNLVYPLISVLVKTNSLTGLGLAECCNFK